MNWFHLILIIAWRRCGAYTRAMSGRYIVVAAVSLFCAFALLYVAKHKLAALPMPQSTSLFLVR
jgi:hypothetical protein